MNRRLVICALLLLVACKRGPEDKADGGPELPAVRVSVVKRGTIDKAVVGSATVESERAVEVLAEASGRVAAVPVEEGDRVTSGQLLCAIENPRAQNALDRARVELQQVERELASTARLNERGYVSRRTHEELEFRQRRGELEVRRAQEEVRALRVTAPFAGVVSRRRVTVGEVIGPQRPLFSLVDDTHLQAVLHIPEAQMQGLDPGLEARARIVASGAEVRGEVLRLAPVIDVQSGTIRVTLRLSPEQGLKPGMLVSARIVVERRAEALLVPQRALELDALKPSVFRLQPGGDSGEARKVERVHPQLGIRGADEVEVLSGLAEGDHVVVAGQAALRDDAEVRVVEWDGIGAAARGADASGLEDTRPPRAAAEPMSEDKPRKL